MAMESPPFESSSAAELSRPIPLFSSLISLMALISKPIRTFSPNFLCPLSGILGALRRLKRRGIALLNAFEFFAARFEFPRLKPRVCWAASILSYQRYGNLLPASTGGAEVTGGGREASAARGFEHGGHRQCETSTDEGGSGNDTRFEWLQKNNAGVASLRGQGTPAYPARLRSERARKSSRILPAARPGSF